MHCSNCGADLQPGAKFCPMCGTPAASQPATTAASVTGPTTLLSEDGGAGYAQQPGQRLDLPEPKGVASGEGKTGMDYQIVGTTMQAVIIQLEPGQALFSETGGMAWMSDNV